MTISDRAIQAIKGNNKLIAALMTAFDRGQNTIENWMNDKDVRLTTPTAVKAIVEHSDLTESDILEQEPVNETSGQK
jgi:hypothetical protein